VLEIGPGGGRWTEVIAPRVGRVIVADVAREVLEIVRERVPGVETVLSPGAALPGVPDGTVDLVWSFDVFVHIAPADQGRYLAEIGRVLRLGGTAAVHHADGRNHGFLPSRAGWRAPMSTRLFAALAALAGLRVERVVRSWSDGVHDLGAFGDAITILRRS
jgi:ubiquinone/menaquinone biosynthesis C-methylase UbiE